MRLDKIQDPETLRKAALILERENERLLAKLIELQRENLKLKGEDPDALQLRIAELERQIGQFQKKTYGNSSEKRGDTHVGNDEKKEPQRGHGPREQKSLPIVEVVHDLDEADKACTACGGVLTEWLDQFEESEEVDVIERSWILKKHKRKKYRCACGGCVETALGPEKLIEGGRYSMNVAVEIAVVKYLDHNPLERQVRIMGREGVVIDSQTLWNQIEALARRLAPAHERLHLYVLGQSVIGVDETRWPLLGSEDSKRWQAWTVAAPNAVCYRIHDTRSTEAARDVLKDFCGTAVADGYSAYSALRKESGRFTLAHCWAHVRRKFLELEETNAAVSREFLDLIGELYTIEQSCPTGPPGDELRRALRNEKSRDVIRRIREKLYETRALPQSALGRALEYAMGLWEGLTRFLDDPRVPIDNNAAERAMRGPVIGRKNHYGSRSRRGTEVAALFYSLLESAKLNEIDPKEYLRQAARAALRGEQIPLPHELSAIDANAA